MRIRSLAWHTSFSSRSTLLRVSAQLPRMRFTARAHNSCKVLSTFIFVDNRVPKRLWPPRYHATTFHSCSRAIYSPPARREHRSRSCVLPGCLPGARGCLAPATARRAQNRGRRHLHSTPFSNPFLISPARANATRPTTDQLAVAVFRGACVDRFVILMALTPWSTPRRSGSASLKKDKSSAWVGLMAIWRSII